MNESLGNDSEPPKKQFEHSEDSQRDPELQTAFDMLDHYKDYQVENLDSASNTIRKGARREIAEHDAMTGVLRSIEKATKRPDNKKTWREHLDQIHSSSTFWDKQYQIAEARGENAVDLVDLQVKAVNRFYDRLAPKELAQHEQFKRMREQAAQQEAATETVDPELERTIEEVYEKGRIAMFASVSTDFAKSRNINSGFQTVVDERDVGTLRDSTTKTGYTFETLNLRGLMNKSELTTAIAIEKLKEHHTSDQKVIPLSKYTGDESDTEPAYRITYVIDTLDPTKNPPKEYQYRDPATNRHGNQLIATIHAPKDVAEKAFTTMQIDRSTALKILERFDPEFIADQRECIPNDHGTFVLPEGQVDQAYERNKNGIPIAIKPEFIK